MCVLSTYLDEDARINTPVLSEMKLQERKKHEHQ